MIEMDVQLTLDGRLVVLHDRELGRTLRGSGPVRNYRLAELQAMDAGSWFGPVYAGEPVLSLDEVLDLTRDRVGLNVEIKSPAADWRSTAVLLGALLNQRERRKSTIVSSFAVGALEQVRTIDETIRLGVLWDKTDLERMWRLAGELRATSVHPHRRLVDANLLRTAQARNLAVITWTVNAEAEIRKLADLGVDGIISDFPERFT